MELTTLLARLNEQPESVEFENCLAVIDNFYDFNPRTFTNGEQVNEAGQNNGSCKIFSFGLLHQLNESQVLNCFGEYYRNDVLNNPASDDHQNIRQFILSGWPGIKFTGQALVEK